MNVHTLKCINPYFRDVMLGVKPFELRHNDRGFCVGDVLHLREYDDNQETYSGREVQRRVVYVLDASEFAGLSPGFVALGLSYV